MGNMLNSAAQAKRLAQEALENTQIYLQEGHDGKKLMIFSFDVVMQHIVNLSKAYGEVNNIMLQYKENTNEKQEMEILQNALQERINFLKGKFLTNMHYRAPEVFNFL